MADFQDKLLKTRAIRLMDLTVLLLNLYRAARDSQIGFEDATRTLDDLVDDLSRTTRVHVTALESALWCANLLAEKGAFWHPKDYTFEQFLARVEPYGEKFDRTYNCLVREEKKPRLRGRRPGMRRRRRDC